MHVTVPAVMPDQTVAPPSVLRRFGVRGLGFCGDEVMDPTTGIIQVDTNCAGSYPPITAAPAPAPSTDWTSTLNSLIHGGFDILKLQNVQPGTTLTAGGAISQQNPGYPIAAGAIASSASSAITSLMPVILIGVVALLLLSKK